VLVVGLLSLLQAEPLMTVTRAQTVGVGVIDGQVKNGTADGPVPAGVEVVLHAVGEGDRVERWRTRTDEQGRFRFERLDTAASVRYLPATEYGGALYYPRPLSLAGQAEQAVEITVYEPTHSDRWIAFERSNLMVQGIAPNRLDLMEMGAVANVGDRTYVGPEGVSEAERSTLRFSLPPGALDVAPQAGLATSDVRPEADGFAIGSPILPGRHQLAFSYGLAFDDGRLELTKRLDYPTMTFNFYVPDVGLEVQSPQLRPQGGAELGGQRYLIYAAQNVPAGTELRVRMVGLPSPHSGVQPLVWSVLGLGCVVLGGGLLMVYRRRTAGRGLVAAASNDGQAGADEVDRMRLLVALAHLDERYEQGELSSEEYQARRAVEKERLLALGRVAGAEAGAD
jgi:hypothetical protein